MPRDRNARRDRERNQRGRYARIVTTALDAIKLAEVLTGGVSDRTENARGIAGEALELLEKLEHQKRAGALKRNPS